MLLGIYPSTIFIFSNNWPTPKLDQKTKRPNTIKTTGGIIHPIFFWKTKRRGG